MSVENKIDLDKFQDEMFQNIAPMGNAKTRIKFINVVDELKEARLALLSFRSSNGGVTVFEMEKWLAEALEAMGKANQLELNIARTKIELAMKAHGVTL